MSIKNIGDGDIKSKEKSGESNLLLSIPSNHVLNRLNESLTTTSSSSQFLATTFLNLLQCKSHSLNLVVLPYSYQESDQNCHRQSFYRAERRFK